jgi:uncharacterized membrane protein YqiK
MSLGYVCRIDERASDTTSFIVVYNIATFGLLDKSSVLGSLYGLTTKDRILLVKMRAKEKLKNTRKTNIRIDVSRDQFMT